MKMLTVGPERSGAVEFSAAMKAAQTRLDGTADLAIAYLPGDRPPQDYLEALAAELSVPLVGATTGGAGFTERGHATNGAVGALLATGGASIALVEEASRQTEAKLRDAIQTMSIGKGRFSSLLVLADGLSLDGDALVNCIRSHLPPHVRIFGGTAGDHWAFEKTFVLHGRAAYGDAVVLVAVDPGTRMGVKALHGWRPVAESRDLTITSIRGNKLRALNDRPAAAVYREELSRLGLWDGVQPIASVAATFELGARSPFGENLVIRAATGFDSPDGCLQLAGGLREGTVLRVVETSADALISAAADLSQGIRNELGTAPSGTLVFDCAARLQLLGDRYEEQVRAFRGQNEQPVLGYACYGEIAKSRATHFGFHNSTAVLASWS